MYNILSKKTSGSITQKKGTQASITSNHDLPQLWRLGTAEGRLETRC